MNESENWEESVSRDSAKFDADSSRPNDFTSDGSGGGRSGDFSAPGRGRSGKPLVSLFPSLYGSSFKARNSDTPSTETPAHRVPGFGDPPANTSKPSTTSRENRGFFTALAGLTAVALSIVLVTFVVEAGSYVWMWLIALCGVGIIAGMFTIGLRLDRRDAKQRIFPTRYHSLIMMPAMIAAWAGASYLINNL